MVDLASQRETRIKQVFSCLYGSLLCGMAMGQQLVNLFYKCRALEKKIQEIINRLLPWTVRRLVLPELTVGICRLAY